MWKDHGEAGQAREIQRTAEGPSSLKTLSWRESQLEQATYNTKIPTVIPLSSPANSPPEISQIVKGGSGAEVQ